MFAGAGGLDGGVQGQDVGLEGDRVDHADDVGDLLRLGVDLAHGGDQLGDDGAAVGGGLGGRGGQGVGLLRVVGVLAHGGGDLFRRGGGLGQGTGLLFGARGQVQVAGADLRRGRGDRVRALAHFAQGAAQVRFATGAVHGRIAMAQGAVVAEVIAGHRRVFDSAVIPAVCFTDPEIVTVGLSPEAARQAGREVRVASFPFQANGRALTLGAEDGFVRVTARADNHLVLGFAAVGAGVSELASGFALALEMGARLEDIGGTIHAHPTLGEASHEASLRALGEALQPTSEKEMPEIRDQVRRIFEADAQADERPAERRLRRGALELRIALDGQAFKAAIREAEAKEFERQYEEKKRKFSELTSEVQRQQDRKSTRLNSSH